MRRPDIELADEPAQYVERHPDVIARLAGLAHDAAEPAVSPEQQARFTGYVRRKLAFAPTSDRRGGRETPVAAGPFSFACRGRAN